MRKLLNIENIPATKSEVMKDVTKITGKSVVAALATMIIFSFVGKVIQSVIEDRALLPKKEK